jgi:hypothetical protein
MEHQRQFASKPTPHMELLIELLDSPHGFEENTLVHTETADIIFEILVTEIPYRIYNS